MFNHMYMDIGQANFYFLGGGFFKKSLFIAFLCDNFSKIPLSRQKMGAP